jgi:hypothetical protein
MSWVATVDENTGDENGCLWAPDITALAVAPGTIAEWDLRAWAGDHLFTVGTFVERRQADEALQALALHVDVERSGQSMGDVNIEKAVMTQGADSTPALLPLGPKSMAVLNMVAAAGDKGLGMFNLPAAPYAVIDKLVPRYLTEHPAAWYHLTAEGQAMVDRWGKAVAGDQLRDPDQESFAT